MGKIFRFLGGATLGAVVGAAAAVLLAPQSGKDLQSKILARRDQALAAGRAEADARERELRAEWQARVDAETIKRQALKG